MAARRHGLHRSLEAREMKRSPNGSLRSGHAPVQLVLTHKGAAKGGRGFSEGAVASQEHKEIVHYKCLVALSAYKCNKSLIEQEKHSIDKLPRSIDVY